MQIAGKGSSAIDQRLVGDPVDVVTGANTDIISDFHLRGPLPLIWRRYYTSARNQVPGPLGWGHTHDFVRSLTHDLDGLHYTDPFGVETPFPALGVGLTAMRGGLVLHHSSANRYQVVQAGQPVQNFDFPRGSETAPLHHLQLGQDQIEFRYDPDGRLTEIIDSLRRSIGIESDQDGKIRGLFLGDESSRGRRRALMVYQYDVSGNLILGRDLYNAELSFAWDRDHRMTRRTDRRGYSFHFQYDDAGRCIHSSGDDGLLEVTLDYQPEAKVTRVRRGDGGTWIYAYNDQQTVTRITDPYGYATTFVLDELGRPIQEADPNGNISTLHYDWREGHDYRIDANGNLLPLRSDDANPADPLAYTLPKLPAEWDFGGLVDVGTAQPAPANDLLPPFPPAAVNAVLDDASSGRDSGSSQSSKHDANGNLIEHQDRDGSTYRYVYRSWNALTDSIDPLGNTTSFELTGQGLMAKVTDPGGTITEYSYDLKERLIEVRELGRVVESYRRDPAGNVIEKTDASGRAILTWKVGRGNLDKVRILRSGETHFFEHNENGRIILASSPAGVATFVYDEEGNLHADQRDGKGVVHEFQDNRLASTTYFGKFRIVYQARPNRERVVEDPMGGRHRFQPGAAGVIAKVLANGSRELCRFDAAGFCAGKALARHAHDPDPWIRRFQYSAAGDLVAVLDNRRGATRYRHDAAHRLAEEIMPGNGSPRLFEHDPAGNLLRQPGLADVEIGEGNRISRANGDTFTYNHRLNLVERRGPSGVTRYQYDDLDMLVSCDIRGAAWTATYDGLGRRCQKIWQGETTTYYWDDFRLAAEVRHDGFCRIYIYADEIALAPFAFIEYEGLDAEPGSGTRYYVFTSQVGTPIRVDDEAGRTVWSARIDPYGHALVGPLSTIELNLRFPGHYFDQETGLHFNRFRYYSPELGRYLQSDPAGLSGGINAYAYRTSPLTEVDINGLARNGATAPKTKDGPFPKVGCHATVKAGLDPHDVKPVLEAKAKKLMKDIKAEQRKNARREKKGEPPVTHVKAPDGTLLQIHASVGPCVSLAYDKKTGKVYYGQNTRERPDPMHPILEDNADKAAEWNKKNFPNVKPPGMYPMKGVPGDHSEVNAVNKGMIEREGDPNADKPHPSDYTVYNVNTNGQGQQQGAGKPCCPNCQKVLGGPNGGPDANGDWQHDPGATDVSQG
jgi:RHS repeat-associated protein